MSPSWVRQSLDLLEKSPCVLITLRQHKGSAPRESGARMVVGADEVKGSIGGGNLEHQAIATAREMLETCRGEGAAPTNIGQRLQGTVGAAPSPRSSPWLEPYGLGPALNQCCGGSVELMFEVLTPPAPDWLSALASAHAEGDPAVLATAIDPENPRHLVALPVGRESDLPEDLRAPVRAMLDDAAHNAIEVVAAEGCDWWLQRVARNRKPLLLFGAGHVGKAVVKALSDLPFEVRWVDSRDYEFPDAIPGNATPVRSDDPLAEVSQAAPQSIFIVMTHSHDLDEDICHAILERGDFAFLGLIGSTSKHRRFVHRLGKRGIADDALERLVCPVGLPGIAGKEPATIALSLAAQLMSAPEEN